MGRDAFFAIRASRALPPSRVLQGEGRSRVYSAALEQFDQLMTGARAVGTATRPLLLFYALSQAGRAVTAARAADRWRLQSHGLSAPQLANPELLDIQIKVKPSPRGAKDQPGAPIDSFRGVADATGSPSFDRAVTIGELWSSLPEIHDLPPQTLGAWPRVLPVLQLDDLSQKLVMWDRVSVAIANVPWPASETLEQQLAHYPATGDLVVERLQPGLREIYVPTTAGDALKCYWPSDEPNVAGHAGTLAARTSTGLLDRDSRWLRPAVGGQAASSLVTWWALLFGLSMIARYEPAGWRRALDYDLSELAAPLDELLEFALDAVPELVLRALRLETTDTE
jgi:hypothetical protein